MLGHSLRPLVSGRALIAVRRGMSVAEVARVMAEKNVGAVPVLDGDRLVGLFSERDLLKRVVARGRDPAALRVEEVMTTELVVANVDDSFEACLQRMRAASCRHLPVLDGGRLLGLVSLRDMLLADIQVKQKQLDIGDRPAEAVVTTQGIELVWKCLRCGHHLTGETAPARCPSCRAPREEFVLVEED